MSETRPAPSLSAGVPSPVSIKASVALREIRQRDDVKAFMQISPTQPLQLGQHWPHKPGAGSPSRACRALVENFGQRAAGILLACVPAEGVTRATSLLLQLGQGEPSESWQDTAHPEPQGLPGASGVGGPCWVWPLPRHAALLLCPRGLCSGARIFSVSQTPPHFTVSRATGPAPLVLAPAPACLVPGAQPPSHEASCVPLGWTAQAWRRHPQSLVGRGAGTWGFGTLCSPQPVGRGGWEVVKGRVESRL